MSYELLLFQPTIGDLLEQARQRMQQANEPASPANVQTDQYKVHMKQAILSLVPDYEILETDFEAIAQEEGMTIAQAQAMYGDIEITPAGPRPEGEESAETAVDEAASPASPQPGQTPPKPVYGPHITIQDRQVIFTLPDKLTPEAALEAFEVTWRLLMVCEKVQNSRVYDPQLDTVLRSLDTLDRNDVWAKYASIAIEVAKPWWKFW